MAGSGQIQPDSGNFGQIRPASDHGRILVRRHPATEAGCRRIPASAVFWWPDVAEFQCCLGSDDRPLLDSGNRISTVCARTKSLISENDLQFLKP
jgi:hypothetical protein